jgi:hypothetical protein
MRWEDPPERSHKGARQSYVKETAELRAHPGEWAVIREFPLNKRPSAYALQSSVTLGRTRSFEPRGTFEAVVRTDGNIVKVYVRYRKDAG